MSLQKLSPKKTVRKIQSEKFSPKNYDSMTSLPLASLQQIATSMHLSATGTKDQINTRISNALDDAKKSTPNINSVSNLGPKKTIDKKPSNRTSNSATNQKWRGVEDWEKLEYYNVERKRLVERGITKRSEQDAILKSKWPSMVHVADDMSIGIKTSVPKSRVKLIARSTPKHRPTHNIEEKNRVDIILDILYRDISKTTMKAICKDFRVSTSGSLKALSDRIDDYLLGEDEADESDSGASDSGDSDSE